MRHVFIPFQPEMQGGATFPAEALEDGRAGSCPRLHEPGEYTNSPRPGKIPRRGRFLLAGDNCNANPETCATGLTSPVGVEVVEGEVVE